MELKVEVSKVRKRELNNPINKKLVTQKIN